MFTLRATIALRAAARQASVVRNRTVTSIVTVAQARFGRNVALLSGPLRQTGTLALVVVHDVARSPILTISGADVVLAVLAVEQRRTLAPLLAVLDDAVSEVAR